MIITRTPFRISFFGGGTDYPVWYQHHGGVVLATTIDKYCYISCRYLPPFFEHKYRIVYSKIENVQNLSEIQHPAVMALRGKYISKDELAGQAIHVEQKVIRENVGSQDQISAAFGGLNRIEFRQDGSFEVSPIVLPKERL